MRLVGEPSEREDAARVADGRAHAAVSHGDGWMDVGRGRIAMTHERDPAAIPHADHGIDVVLECSGHFNTRGKAALHLAAGARRVLVSAPCENADATIVHGVNHADITADMKVVSNASCTTNCLAPVAKVMPGDRVQVPRLGDGLGRGRQARRLRAHDKVAAAAALAAPHAALAAAKPEELEVGAQTFSSVCAACHLGGANVVRPEKTLDLTTLTNNKVADADAILAQVTNGKNNMPAFGGRHAERQLQHARDVTHAARTQAERRADLRGLAVRRLPGEGGVEQGAAVRQVSGQARRTRQQQHARARRDARGPPARYVPATLLRVYGME